MTVFGLTGGIASGKSTVAEVFREGGVEIVDADLVAREVVAKGTPGLEALVRAFGASILLEDGELDRKTLGALAFADPEKRRALNAITHPRIAHATQARLAALAGKLACYEAALLVENGLADAFRPLVVVAAPEEVQLRRILARDGLSEREARDRLAAQMPTEAKLQKADHVIWNDGTREDLVARARDVLALIRASSSRSTDR